MFRLTGIQRFLSVLFFAGISVPALLPGPSGAPLDTRVFSSGTSVWFYDGGSLTTYRSKSKAARLVLSDSDDNDTIRDVSQSGTDLWVSARSGLYRVEMGTENIEKIPAPGGEPRTGRVASDGDFLWLASGDTLWKFDLLSREWIAFPLSSGHGPSVGIWSDGNEVVCIGLSDVRVFSIIDEKWLALPHAGFTLETGSTFLVDKGALIVASPSAVRRYLPSRRAWDRVTLPETLVDIFPADTVILYLTTAGLYRYSITSAAAQRLDIPGIAGSLCLSGGSGDTVLVAGQRTLYKYSIGSRGVDYIEYPPALQSRPVKMSAGPVMMLPEGAVADYDAATRTWEIFPLDQRTRKRTIASWDDEGGLRLRYAPGWETRLSGSAQQDIGLIGSDTAIALTTDTSSGTPDPTPDTLRDKVLYWGNYVPAINLNLRNSFPGDRSLDLFFDNTNISRVPTKGGLYRGARADRLALLKAGTSSVQIAQSKTVPEVRFEGAAAEVESKTVVTGRDRKIVRVQTGAGLRTTRSEYQVLKYRDDAMYVLSIAADHKGKELSIVPGSLRITVDGEVIDSSLFAFAASTGDVRFVRTDIVDPTSVIAVSYQVETVPDSGLRTIEFMPGNNFGEIEYGAATVSPASWISARLGAFSTWDRERRHVAHAALPLEFRGAGRDFLLRIDPEFSYDPATQARAGGIGVRSRIGKATSFIADAVLADTIYAATDRIEQEYGAIRHDVGFTVSHDLRPEVPLSYSQHFGSYGGGEEQRYDISGGLHLPGLPYADVSLSRTVTDVNLFDSIPDTTISFRRDPITLNYLIDPISSDTLRDTVIDSGFVMDRVKDKLRIRVYELTSPWVEKLLGLNRLNYEISYTGLLAADADSDRTDRGTVLYGRMTVSPTSRITLTGLGTFRDNPLGSRYAREYNPQVTVSTIDLPRGIDLSLDYRVIGRLLDGVDTTLSSLERSAGIVLRPGAWFPALSWFSPFAKYAEDIRTAYADATPPAAGILFGDPGGRKRRTPSVGINLYPTGDILFRNDNRWALADTVRIVSTLNDLKWSFYGNRLWQTRWEYNRAKVGADSSRDRHQGFTRYDHPWTGWLKTSTGINLSHTRIRFLDSTGADTTALDVRTGPEVAITLNKGQGRVLRKLLNTHTVGIAWRNRGSSAQLVSPPEIGYTVFLRAVIVPNFTISMRHGLSVEEGAFAGYNGMVGIAATF